ncbi:hypothetical protein NC651_019644 [Populus alba x Populus x berolinensis]|nr:hypothetical protein NC651_019644 [Populus alba x Populus x berolinensis]
MVTREVPLTLGSGIEEANLDFEDERSEGKAVAMPQLINVLAAAIYSLRICGEVKLRVRVTSSGYVVEIVIACYKNRRDLVIIII